MEVHFIDVGCGDMTLILMPNGTTFIIDCNVTNDNKENVIKYLKKVMGTRTKIDVFVNTHRDADHMRGIKTLHNVYPIQIVWDSGVAGTTTDSNEYKDYMDLRRTVGFKEVKAGEDRTYEGVKIRVMNSRRDDYTEANSQSIVIKAEYKTKRDSVFITGDTDYKPWKEKILTFYSDEDLQCAIFQAAHHGSITFFDDPSDQKNYYTSHIKKANPAMSIISVGSNTHGLPDDKAVELYEKNSSGSRQGNKVFTTEKQGNIKVVFKGNGGWSLTKNN